MNPCSSATLFMVSKIKFCDFLQEISFNKLNLFSEIWKNSSIMAFHILSVAQYRASPGFVTADLLSDVVVEFQKNYDVSHDLAFVGCPKRVSDNCLELYGDQAVAALSNVAVDLLKLESIMSRSLI